MGEGNELRIFRSHGGGDSNHGREWTREVTSPGSRHDIVESYRSVLAAYSYSDMTFVGLYVEIFLPCRLSGSIPD